jgi:hypothetical protein
VKRLVTSSGFTLIKGLCIKLILGILLLGEALVGGHLELEPKFRQLLANRMLGLLVTSRRL